MLGMGILSVGQELVEMKCLVIMNFLSVSLLFLVKFTFSDLLVDPVFLL